MTHRPDSAQSIAPDRPSRRLRAVDPSPKSPRWDHGAEIKVLRRLWDRQRDEDTITGVHGADYDYVAAHFAMDLTLRRRLRVLDQIGPILRGRVFEWGCQHGLDSCVYRLRYGDALELHGADLYAPGPFHVFHEFSGLRYARLTHHVGLPYPDGFFDVVTSNGVLEHVHDDNASLREVFRVLRPGGTLVVTCLPNRWSYTEAAQRILGHNAHDRLYTHRSAAAMLRGAGFEVRGAGHAFLLPTMLYGFPPWAKAAYARLDRPLSLLNAALERLWPLRLLASNLWLLAHRPGA